LNLEGREVEKRSVIKAYAGKAIDFHSSLFLSFSVALELLLAARFTAKHASDIPD